MTARWLVARGVRDHVFTAVAYHAGRIGECSVTPDAYWTLSNHCVSKMDALYLSTITRSTGVLLGAAFAMVWRPRAIMRSRLRHRSRMLDLIAIVGLAILGLQFWFLSVANDEGEANAWLFRGGFLVTASATLMMIAAVTHRYAPDRPHPVDPPAAVGRHPLVRALPVPLADLPDHPQGGRCPAHLPQFIGAMVVTVTITEVSYRFLEMPIRRRQFWARWDDLRRRGRPALRQAMAMSVVVCLLLLAVGVIRLGLAELKPNEVEATLEPANENTTSLDNSWATTARRAAPQARPRRRMWRPGRRSRRTTGSVPSTVESTTTTSTSTDDDDDDAALRAGRLPRRR